MASQAKAEEILPPGERDRFHQFKVCIYTWLSKPILEVASVAKRWLSRDYPLKVLGSVADYLATALLVTGNRLPVTKRCLAGRWEVRWETLMFRFYIALRLHLFAPLNGFKQRSRLDAKCIFGCSIGSYDGSICLCGIRTNNHFMVFQVEKR